MVCLPGLEFSNVSGQFTMILLFVGLFLGPPISTAVLNTLMLKIN